MPSIFTKIIQREIPSYIIYEDEKCIVFLDAFPLQKGHLLVVPKLEVDKIYELPEEDFLHIHKVSKQIAFAIEKSFDCKRVGVCVIGLEVPHAHIHLIPINKESDMSFQNPKMKLNQKEFETIKNIIIKNL